MQTFEPYRHRVQYYETDMMGVTHHANYIRWMEEARIDFMDQLGFPYREMEAMGIVSPVTRITCDYRRASTFGDTVSIAVSVRSFDGVTLSLGYRMTNEAGETVCEAGSRHCFLNREGHFVRLKRTLPDFCQRLLSLCPADPPQQGK